jgi:hypothetical protein
VLLYDFEKVPDFTFAVTLKVRTFYFCCYLRVREFKTGDRKENFSDRDDKVLWNEPQHVNGIFVGQLEQFDFRRFSDVSDFVDVCYVIVIIDLSDVIVVKVVIDDDRDGVNSSLK